MGDALISHEQILPIALSSCPYGIPPSEHMIPGETYVGRLPGRTRKAFVRKRPSVSSPIIVNQITPSSTLVHALQAPAKMGMFSRARRDGYYVSYGPAPSRPKYVCTRQPDVLYAAAPPPSGRTATSVRQTCAACGRFRSARWEADHPLLPGTAAASSICAKCQHEQTSSEEWEPRLRHRKYHHRHSRHCTERTDESYCSLRDRRSPRRYRSDSRDYSRPRKSSRDNVRIVIANQPGAKPSPQLRRRSSTEGVRIVRRTSVVEVPERVRSRSRTGSSSRAYYLDDGTAQYAEDLVRPHYRTRSRSLSRASYIEELAPPVSRHKRRSSSRVQFVDDLEEPVLVPRPRRISRRRAIYFDGPGSFEILEGEERGRPRPQASQPETHDPVPNVPLTEVITTQYHGDLPQARKDNSEHKPSEENQSLHRHHTTESTLTDDAPGMSMHASFDEAKDADYDGVHYRQQSDSAAYDVASDYERTPRQAFRSVSASQVAGHARKTSGHKRRYSRSADSTYQEGPLAARDEHVYHAADRSIDGPATPQNKRRRRYRDDSSEHSHSPVTPLTHHPIRSPSPSNPHSHSDYLSEMLKSSHITPPSERALTPPWAYARGPASPPLSRRVSESEDSAYRPPVYSNATAYETGYGPTSGQYSPVEDLYGNKVADYGRAPAEDLYGNKISDYDFTPSYDEYSGDWPRSAATVDYDWM